MLFEIFEYYVADLLPKNVYFIHVDNLLENITTGGTLYEIYDVDLISSGLTLELKYVSFKDGSVINTLKNKDVSEMDYGVMPNVLYIQKTEPKFIRREFSRKIKFRDIYMLHLKYISRPDWLLYNYYYVFIPLWINFTVYDDTLLENVSNFVYRFLFYSYAHVYWKNTNTGAIVDAGIRSIRRQGYAILNLSNKIDFREGLCIIPQYSNFDIIHSLKVDNDIVALIYFDGSLDELQLKIQNEEVRFIVYDKTNLIAYYVPSTDIYISELEENKYTIKFEIATAINNLGMDEASLELNII